MLILLAHSVDEDVLVELLGENVIYRPDLERKGLRALEHALVQSQPDVLVTRSGLHPAAAVAWRAAMPETSLFVIADGVVAHDDGDLSALDIAWFSPYDDADGLLLTLAEVERAWTRSVTCAPLDERLFAARAASKRLEQQTVTIVGAGIVNLVAAYELVLEGYEVSVYDACPDPRPKGPWTSFGCTSGGGNARMFSLTEADNYNEKVQPASGDINQLLAAPISEYGWRICDPTTLSPDEVRWAEDYERVPTWLATAYNDDIFLFNRQAGQAWESFRERDPSLFDDVDLQDGVLRIYTDAKYLAKQVARQKAVGAFRRELDPAGVASSYPALADAVGDGTIAGGIEIVGFTLSIHDFVARLLDALEAAGAHLHWERPVRGVKWTSEGTVAGVLTRHELVKSDHYVLSPGAYGTDLLAGTASAGQIHGVLGAWLTVPNLDPELTNSLKLARAGHMAEDSNVTVTHDESGRPTLTIGSGYGWTGSDPSNIDPDELELLYDAVADTAKRFFPRPYEAAMDEGLLHASRKYCVRPWTASSLGVFEIVPARSGGVLVVTGGHNTGGFTQSPVTAAAVVAAIRGEAHEMHHLYHPLRLRNFLQAGTRPTKTKN